MANTPEQIAAKIHEVYEIVAMSDTPISMLGTQGTLLRVTGEFTRAEVEFISSEVLTLLIRHGWRDGQPFLRRKEPHETFGCSPQEHSA